MAASSPGGVPTWSVAGIVDDTLYDPARGLQRAKRVTVQTWFGVTFTVVVPEAEFSKARVAQLIAEQYDKAFDVYTLQGGALPPELTGS